MNKLLIIACMYTLVSSCSPIKKCNSNDNRINEFGQRYELQVHNFSEIPIDLLDSMNKMGVDNSSILNEYEGRYFNFIFKINTQDFNLVGKKVGFLKNKMDYFNDTRNRFCSNSTTVGGSYLCIFDTIQKQESGGYDAAIVYWSKFVIPNKEIINSLKKKQQN